jgi:hypothetical protein
MNAQTMRPAKFLLAALLAVGALAAMALKAEPAPTNGPARDYKFDGKISRPDLQN